MRDIGLNKTVYSVMTVSTFVLAVFSGNAWAGAAPVADNDLPFRTGFEVAPDPALAAQVPADIRKAGYIVIGTNPNTPPTTYYAEDNHTLEGREIDIMSAVSKRLGLTPRWRSTGGFDNIIPGLSSGRYQAAISNIDANAKRMEHVDFVSYFNSNRFGMISRSGPGTSGTPLTDLGELCGKVIGAGAGTGNLTLLQSENEKCVVQGKAGIDIPVFPNRPAGVQSVATGRIPNFMGPYDGIRYMTSVSRGTLVLSGVFNVPQRHMSVALRKDSSLTDSVRDAMNSLIKDGTYGKILDKWDLEYGAVTESFANRAILNGEPDE